MERAARQAAGMLAVNKAGWQSDMEAGRLAEGWKTGRQHNMLLYLREGRQAGRKKGRKTGRLTGGKQLEMTNMKTESTKGMHGFNGDILAGKNTYKNILT
jgi:hypothetical protein